MNRIRRLALATAIVLGLARLWATQLVSDGFSGGDAGNLGANWTDVVNGFDVVSGAAKSGGVNNVLNMSCYTGASWTDPVDQYVETEMRQQGSSSDGGVMARGSLGANTGYIFDVGDGTTQAVPGTLDRNIYKVVAGSFSQPTGGAGGNGTISVGDVLKLEATGTTTTTLKAYVNGTLIITATDSSSPITSGKPCLWNFQHVNDNPLTLTIFDNFAAGDVGGGSPPAVRSFFSLLGVGP